MTANPLDFDLTDAQNGDTEAMERVLQDIIAQLSNASQRERLIAERLAEACSVYKLNRGGANKVHSDICGAMGLRRDHGRQRVKPEDRERIYRAVEQRMFEGVSGVNAPVGYKKAIDLLFSEKNEVLNLVPNTGPENIRKLYNAHRAAKKEYQDAINHERGILS